MLKKLQEAGRRDLADYMAFEVTRDPDHPTIQNDGMQYEGLRFRVVCRLAGKLYGQPFGLDIAFGDRILGDSETITADDVLAFAGIAPSRVRVYPIVTHIAEKLHAYTMPRKRPNTRVKDLPDIALLATIGPLEATRLRMALELTFNFRATHPLPSFLPDPPAAWALPYTEMARSNGLERTNLAQLASAAGAFLNHVLSSSVGIWNPLIWGDEVQSGAS